jgi:mycothiol synthase
VQGVTPRTARTARTARPADAADAADATTIERALGPEPERVLGDVLARDLMHPAPGSAAFVLDHAYARVAPLPRPGQWEVAVAGAGPHEVQPLLEAARRHVADNGGGVLTWWHRGDGADDAAVAAGFAPDRAQLELVGAIAGFGEPDWPEGIRGRDFDPSRDTDAWLVCNNRAFAGHPEQGAWRRADLDSRLAEPWCSPTRLVVAARERDDHLVGFNWLKWHAGAPRGEIYVIAVDPDAAGAGIGRALVLEGAARLRAVGCDEVYLFVAAENQGAIALYESLGMSVRRRESAYSTLVRDAVSR